MQARIVAVVTDGAHVDTACAAEGIDRTTYYRWMQWGKEGKEPYSEFFDAVTRARAQAELDLLRTAKDGDELGSSGPARCAQWLLERTRGKRYAARVSVKVEEELETLLDVLGRVCSGKDCGCLEGVLAALAARDGGEEAQDPPSPEGEELH
jgi:hypothetical protein